MEVPSTPDGRPPAGGSLWLHPDDDLAPNRPGETLHGRLAGLPTHPARRLVDRLLLRPDAAGELRARLRGEQLAGARLDQLTAAGWRVVHSVPLPGRATIAHLLVGPGGVWACHTVCHRAARLRVGEDTVEIARPGRRPRAEPHVRLCRRAAVRAAHALSRGCGFPVAVRAALVCVAAARVAAADAPDDVEVVTDADLAAFARRGGVLRPDVVETVYAVARDRRTWREA